MANSTAIRYGKIETFVITGDTVEATAETIHDYETSRTLTRTTRTFFVEDSKHVLAEFLKLAEELEKDGIAGIAFECDKQPKHSPYKLSVSWVNK